MSVWKKSVFCHNKNEDETILKMRNGVEGCLEYSDEVGKMGRRV